MRARQTSQQIDAEAADWAARVDGAPLSASEQSELDAWLAKDNRRLGAYAKARAVFAHARRARALGPDFDAADFAPEPVGVRPAPSRRRVLWFGGAVAASVAAATVGVRVNASRFQTKLGEVRLAPLPDGSSMTLNTATRAVVDYSPTLRRVRLIEGEALFDVAKDPDRPFVVEAAGSEVRAIGTSFSVSCLAGRPVQVLVRQGVVEVKGGAEPVRAVANTRVVTAPSGTVAASVLPADQVARELVWREGLLSFEDMPLEQAAAEFARYSDTRIVIDDPAVAQETVTGLFSANNPAGFAMAVARTLDLNAETAPGQVRLYR